MLKQTLRLARFFAIAALSAYAASSYAGGFQLFEASASGLGNAFAGNGATAYDASTEFYNPAGMTLLKNAQITTSGTLIDLDVDAKVNSAKVITSAEALGVSVSDTFTVPGSSDTSPGGVDFVPSLHTVVPFDNHRFAIGFGVDDPYGLKTSYPGDSMAAYLATKSSLVVINAGPALAMQITPKLSAGVGVFAQYLDADLNQKVHLQLSLAGTALGEDGSFTNTADGTGVGWDFGVLYQLSAQTRVGVNYRSEVKHDISGDAELNTKSFSTGSSPTLSDINEKGSVSSDIIMPATADLSFYHQINPRWAVMGGIDYTFWHSLNQVTLNFGGDLASPSSTATVTQASIPLNFENTFRYSLGLNYAPTSKFTFRSGLAYDESPVVSADDRTFRLPDSNRFWLAIGGQYIINKYFTVDAGYSHLFIKPADINQTEVINAGVDGNKVAVTMTSSAVGEVDSSANEYGLQLTWNIV